MAHISCTSLYPATRSPRGGRVARLVRRPASGIVSAILVAAVGCRDSGSPIAPETGPGLVTAAVVGLFPELQTVVPQDVQLFRSGSRETIRFSNAIANTGSGPLQIVPRFPPPGGGGTQDAIQQILDANGRVVQERLVSRYQFHPGHNHWHIARVAVYAIRSGSLTGPVLGDRQKTTFCLIDVLQLAGIPNQAPRRYTQCNSGEQGISVGWADEYGWYLDDQDLDITGAAPGTYYLISTVNAGRRFLETTYTNNRAWVSFRLRRDASGRATIRVLSHSPCTGALCGSSTGIIRRFARPAP